MSTPICSRCQKIYTAGSAPAKCINCGGDVRVPSAQPKPVAQTTPKATPGQSGRTSPTSGNTVNRPCTHSRCEALATHSIKYYYTGKKIVMAPAPSIEDRDARDLCSIHAKKFLAPNTWTLVHAQTLPSLLDGPKTTSTAGTVQSQITSSTTSSSEDGCLTTFITIIFGIIAFAAIAFVGGFIVLQILNFLSGIDMGDSPRPIRVPFRWRR